MLYFEPQKGKAFDDLPDIILRKFNTTNYYVSTKFDGNQIFISKLNGKVTFATSDWKQFELPAIGNSLVNIEHDFVLVGEFMNACQGKLGDRKHSAVLTTYRTAFNKGFAGPNDYLVSRSTIKIFDYLPVINGQVKSKIPYLDRLGMMPTFTHPSLQPIIGSVMTGLEALSYTKELVNVGWEGCMLVEPHSHYHIGKRVNHSIKLKFRKTADLLCINTELGTGKYDGMIGALVLQDSKGRLARVGSGLNDYQRSLPPRDFIGNIIEVEYEQLMDTYVQPTFVQVRYDKKVSD